jgi:hypothetical protein
MMDINTIIVDNFLDNPDRVRESALSLDFYRTGEFPGARSDRADYEYEAYITAKIESVLNLQITEFRQDSFCFQLCLDDHETWLHHDETQWAGILYLTPNAPAGAGTAIYRHVPTGIYAGPAELDVKDIDNWEIITAIGNVYNRMVLYKGQQYHRSLIPGFGNSAETGRLTQTFFFNTDNKYSI